MYNIYRISEDQNSKLEKIHNKVIVPIVEYYESFNNVYDQDVVVDNISDEIPGKIINLAISGVSCSKIYADIRRDIFNVKSLLYSYEITKDGFIQLVFK